MALFNMFKKEVPCQTCANQFPKNKLFNFDSTFRGERKTGQKLLLCLDCFISKMAEGFRDYKSKAIVVYPLPTDRGFSAYQFYNFEDMKKYEFSGTSIDELKLHLPPLDTKCCLCQNKANYSWCSPDIYYNDPYMDKIKTTESFPKEHLCAACLSEKFAEKIIIENIYFSEFFPPVDADGVCTSFEV